MAPINGGKSSLDRVLWVVIFIGMVLSSFGGTFSVGSFFLMPTPLVILNVLVSPINAGLLIVGASVFFLMEGGFGAGLAFFMLIGVSSQVLGFMIRRNSRVSRVLFWNLIFVLVSSMLLLFLGSLHGGTFGETLLNDLTANLTKALDSSGYGNTLTSEDFAGFIPFFVFYLMFIFIACNFFLSRWILASKGILVVHLTNLWEFQLPSEIIKGTLLIIAMALGAKSLGWSGGSPLVDTVLYFSAFTFMFQGLALGAWFMRQREVPMAWQTVVLAALLLLAGPVGLGLAGLLDVLRDFRRQRGTGGNP